MGKVILFLEKNTWVTILINLLCIDFHSCRQYFEQGITKNGYYYMKQENNSISRVYCEFVTCDLSECIVFGTLRIRFIGGNQGGRNRMDPSFKLLQLKREAKRLASYLITKKQKSKYG